jgi:hypothetical protein
MKKSGFLVLAATFMSSALSSPGQDYEYQFTAPINGQFQQGAADPGNSWQGIGQLFDFGTLTETLYYDPTANTLQQTGSFTLSATTFSGSFEDDKVISGGALVPATVLVTYTLNNGNSSVSFNSGVLSVGANPAMNWSIPFTEAITVMTGGQSYDSVLSGNISEANTITSLSEFTPGSVVISQGIPNNSENIYDPNLVDTVTAADGWSANIYDAVSDGYLGESYYVDPVTAYAVPEPGTLMMFSVGAFGLKFIFRRQAG